MKIWPYSAWKVFVVTVLIIAVTHVSGCKHDVQSSDFNYRLQIQNNQESSTGNANEDLSIEVTVDDESEIVTEDDDDQEVTGDSLVAQVPQLKQLINTKIAEAQLICAENDVAISELRKKLNLDLESNEREEIEDDIDWKVSYNSLVEKLIKRLSKSRMRIERAEMMISDLERVQGLIDEKFLAELDQAIQEMNSLLQTKHTGRT
jgi:hypothetical protein